MTQRNYFESSLGFWFILTLSFQFLDFLRNITNIGHIIAVLLNIVINKELTMYSV